MTSAAVQQFLEQGQRSGLLCGAAAQEVVAHLTADPAITVDELASGLMEKKILTRYQADELMAGRGGDCLIPPPFQLFDKGGAGGLGGVYKACDTKLDRIVALKVLPAGRLHQADAVARFQREAKALARLSHPHIIQAYDSGEDAGRNFLVMEYVEGLTLDQVLRHYGALPPTLAADLIHQAALGLQHAHEKGLIHRDLKPGNLLVTGFAPRSPPPFPPEGEKKAQALSLGPTVDYPGLADFGRWKSGQVKVKILDLGLARFLQDLVGGSQLTQEGMGVGTPDYMAPEQFRDALHADTRTDIYGLGCTLYHLIAGQVPFPGTSFSEKAQAHAKKQPMPLEERCPDVPGGLAFVVAKMMAKHPAERFQTAQAAADALVPYVAGGSYSMIRLRQTGLWPGAQPTMRQRWRGRRLATRLGGGAAAAILLVLLVVFVPGFFNPPESDNPDGNPPNGKPVEPPKPQIAAEKPKKKPVAPAKPQIETIENGWTVAQDGTGQFKTIGEALEKVKPGQTILVLDAGDYPETIRLAQASRYANITLEAPKAATLSAKVDKNIVVIHNVPGVTIRGFGIRSQGAVSIASVAIVGQCAGTRLEQLDIASGFGVVLWGITGRDEEPPVLVQDCTLKINGPQGIRISGIDNDLKSSRLCRRIVLRGNRIRSAHYGVMIHGLAEQVQIVGNRISGAELSGIALLNLLPGTKDILIANNTLWENNRGFTLFHDTKKELPREGILVKNNLVVKARNRDFVFLDGIDIEALTGQGEGDGASLLTLWRFSHNWREGKAPGPEDELRRAWIPPSPKTDVLQKRIPLLSTDSQSPDFLRPAKNSPLAKGGAGGDLPSYVGAVPPKGVEPWNWQWTWDAVVDKRLTVSKDPKMGGRFRTIGAALKAIKPKMTLRVLDAEKYAEPLVIDDAKLHEGLVLEAPEHATLVLRKDSPQAVLVRGVAHVRVHGFRFEDEESTRPNRTFVVADGACPGLVLEELDCTTATNVHGIVLLNTFLPPDAQPILVRKCHIHVNYDGIFLTGLADTPVRRVMIVDNRIKANRGIHLEYAVQDALLAGNVVLNGNQAGIQFENPLPNMKRVLVANNTLANNGVAVRLWRIGQTGKFEKGQAELRGNLLMLSPLGDMLYYHQAPGEKQGAIKDSRMLLDLWTFGQNVRELRGAELKRITPLAEDDRQLDPAWLLSRIATDPDFLRPKADLPLATGGAGGDLPAYVGAIPPEGVPAWDWHKTWKARAGKKENIGP